jgi:hypothetical protein
VSFKDMVPCCFRRHVTVRNFTVLLIHVLHVSHPAALEGSTHYGFVGKPKRLKVPNHQLYKYELSEGLTVVFEVETRLIKRYIPPYSEFNVTEVERTDFIPLSGCTQRQVADMRVSYMDL